MAVRIRLRRMGAKRRPFYRLVVADSHSRRDGEFIEELGYYDPVAEPAVLEIKKERVEEWIQKGAIPSPTVRTLLRQAGISMGKS
ncbi:MAG: 30S ribosomal protein S16 [Bacillota bacterium]|nr:30S ribosomal protein S16 [Bacillota bacterium]